jgi:hypothetical protein
MNDNFQHNLRKQTSHNTGFNASPWKPTTLRMVDVFSIDTNVDLNRESIQLASVLKHESN